MFSHRKGILLDGIGSELVRASSGGVRKTLSKWLSDLSAAITLGDVASTFTSGDATPSVLNNSKFITAGTTPITNFDDGVEGQTITIYRGASDIVITDNATIDPIIAGNLTLSTARPSATFRLASGVWKQVEEAGAFSSAMAPVVQAATISAAMELLDQGAFTSTGATTARSLADRFADVVNVKDFGAVGDGVTNDGPAFLLAAAAGNHIIVPYTANGYNIGTTTITVAEGQSWTGLNMVKLISTTTTRLFSLSTGYTLPRSISGFRIDMTGSGASSKAIRFENTSTVGNINLDHIEFSNCVCAIGDVGTAGYIFEIRISNIRCTLTRGTQISSQRSQGFVFLKNVNVDNTLAANVYCNWTSISFERVAGLLMEDVDVTGQTLSWSVANAYTNAFETGARSIVISGTGAPDGFVWLRRVRSESSMGHGILVSNLIFLRGNEVEGYGNLGFQVYIDTVNEGQLTDVTARGMKGEVGAAASAHGFALINCNGVQATNVVAKNNTGNGILLSGASCLYNTIINAQCWDNTLYGVADASSADNNMVVGADLKGNTAGATSISGANSAVILQRGSAATLFLNTPSSANLRALLSDETGTGPAVFATSPTLVTPLLGTPTSGILTNCTGLPIASGVSGLAANVATFLATPSSANLAAALTDESGGTIAMFGTAPTSWTPAIAVGGSASGVTYSGQIGNYTRIGDMVYAFFYIEVTNNGSGSGTVTITGLPLTSANQTYNFGAVTCIQGISGMASIAGAITARIGPNSATATLYQQGATGVAALTETNVTDTAVLTGMLIYKV